MASKFAEGTSVPVEKTRIEVEEVVRRFGADSFVSGYEGRTAFIAFRAMGRMVRLTLAMPDPDDDAFTLTPAGRARDAGPAREAYEAECRRRWRALALLVKAKVTAVSDGVVTFEEEFLPHIVLADGSTVYQAARGPLAIAYETGEMPRLLPGPKG